MLAPAIAFAASAALAWLGNEWEGGFAAGIFATLVLRAIPPFHLTVK